MIRKNITIAFRNLRKHKFFSIVNIIGLALGLAASFFLLLYILNETGYEKCHVKRDRIYRIIEDNKDYNIKHPNVPIVFAEYMKKDFPEIERIASTRRIWGISLQKGENQISERNVYAADPSVFDIFTFPILMGNKNEFLKEPNSVVISEKIAKKYFGEDNPIGKELKMKMRQNKDTYVLKVEGVFKSCKKTTFRAEILLHTNMIWERSKLFYDDKSEIMSVTSSISNTYLLIRKGNDILSLQEKMPTFKEKYVGDKNNAEYTFQALTNVYFHSRDLRNGPEWGDLNKLKTFTYIALLILFIACANYIILSIAQSSSRFTEVGIRKLVGATPQMLKKQILIESVLISFIAAPIALFLMKLTFPFMSEILSTQLDFTKMISGKIILGLLFITIVVGLISGSYLSIFLSGLNPISVFRKKFNSKNARSLFRVTLIAFQIVVFVVLLIIVLVISSQINYSLQREIGYHRENIFKLILDDDLESPIEGFITEIKKNPNVINATAATSIPPDPSSGKTKLPHYSNSEQKVVVEDISVDENFIETMGIKILEGRNFSKRYSNDTIKPILISKTAIDAFGLPDSPIGKRIKVNDKICYEIIGVFQDVFMRSAKEKQFPMLFHLLNDYTDVFEIGISYQQGTYGETKALVTKAFEESFPDFAYETMQTDEVFDYIYFQEFNLKKILYIFIALAIFISMLGLFALSLFMIKQRAKDIGIRKVYGARTLDIIKVIIKEFIILVVIANIVAIPIGYYFSNQWLSEYAYRVDFSFLPYLISFILSVILVSITVTLSAIKTSNINPVDSINIQN